MCDKWIYAQKAQIWKTWGGITGWYDAFKKHSGLLDNSPLKKYIDDFIGDKVFHRKYIAGAVEVSTGSFVQIDLDNFSREEWPLAILSSASVPIAFPMVHLRDMHLIDGGTVWNLNMIGAVEECEKLGVTDHKNIILDVFMLSNSNVIKKPEAKNYNTHQYWQLYKDIKSVYKTDNDLAEFMRAYPNLTYRYFVQPTEDLLPDWELLYPVEANSRKLVDQGKGDAKKSINMGPGKSFEKFLKNLHQDGI